MRDHVTDELISAYVDGELEGDELKLVEDLLAESAEHRELLAEFQSLRTSLWSLPSLDLPDDFHSRVVRQIEERRIAPAKELLHGRDRDSAGRPWRGVLLAAASLAAVVVLTMMLRPPVPTPARPGPSTGVTTPVAMPVYFQQAPKYVMVYDVTVTAAGRDRRVVESVLTNLGIGIDPALRLDGKLEQDLMVVRESKQLKGEAEATPYKHDSATPKGSDRDQVEMIYVASTIGVLDQFGRQLEQIRNTGTEISQLHYDLAIEPNKVGVMHRLHDAAREHFAHRTEVIPSDVGQAFRLAFRFELANVSGPGTAAFPVLTISPEFALSAARGERGAVEHDVNGDGATTAADAAGVISALNRRDDESDRDLGNGIAQAGQPVNWDMQPGHILLIIRHVGAQAADAK